MRRTQYLVKILVEEKLAANDYRETHNIYSFSFVSSKHHSPSIGLEREIKEKLWKPFYEKHFTGGRYIIDMTARPIVNTKDIKIPKKYRCKI
ncbi:hypothetical protein [Enterococcus hermanniensis]|uniref:hypothetical protein n=1 Tax=Enterococcus hermanniensis TaxID=249189 RepID=UPI00361C518D